MRMSLNLQRMMMSTKYREVFPHMRVGWPGWTTNTTLTEFPGFDGSFRATTINGEITGFGIDLGILDDSASRPPRGTRRMDTCHLRLQEQRAMPSRKRPDLTC
jgi:hypothetical protein